MCFIKIALGMALACNRKPTSGVGGRVDSLLSSEMGFLSARFPVASQCPLIIRRATFELYINAQVLRKRHLTRFFD